jgi:hypothetical protein
MQSNHTQAVNLEKESYIFQADRQEEKNARAYSPPFDRPTITVGISH